MAHPNEIENLLFGASAAPNKGQNHLFWAAQPNKCFFSSFGSAEVPNKAIFSFIWFSRQVVNLPIREEWSSKCVPQALKSTSVLSHMLRFARTLGCERHVWRVMANANSGKTKLFGASANSSRG